MTNKQLFLVTSKVIVFILAILGLAAIACKNQYDNNVFYSHERLNQILSRENISKYNRYLYSDSDLVVTPELSDIIDVQNWTKVKQVAQEDETPILVIEYTDFQFIYIYDTYACLADGDGFLPMPNAYYTFSHDISHELLAYLQTCEVNLPYTA